MNGLLRGRRLDGTGSEPHEHGKVSARVAGSERTGAGAFSEVQTTEKLRSNADARIQTFLRQRGWTGASLEEIAAEVGSVGSSVAWSLHLLVSAGMVVGRGAPGEKGNRRYCYFLARHPVAQSKVAEG